MVRSTAARDGGRLPRGLRPVVFFGACLWCIALSAPVRASAEEPGPEFTVPVERASEPPLPAEVAECPALLIPEAYEAEEVVPRQLTLLRSESARTCHALADRLDTVSHRLWWQVAEQLEQLHVAGRQVEELEQAASNGATADNRLEQIFEALQGTLTVNAPAGVEVTNQPDSELVRQAVVDNSETVNQNMWSIVGLLVGFGMLAAIYKLVRP